MIDVLMVLTGNAVLGVACYLLGVRRTEKLIAYRERQAARVDGFSLDADEDEPVYRKCQCGHNTVSHRVNSDGRRTGCVALAGKGDAYSCACQGYAPDPATLIKAATS